MIKVRQKLGKYLIERKLGEGGFAAVYQALDTIEGVRVALKIPYSHLITKDVMDDFRREIRMSAQLKHPHILPLKNAEVIDGRLLIAYPLGEETLADRMERRMPPALAIDFAEQMTEAVAYAHERHIIHCDIKPENLILFPDHQLMLTDFGIAKVAQRTIDASGSGTVGYVAPEQAMGKPSLRSDVFSLGLIIYRLLSGELPEWPFDWPPPGYAVIRRRLHPDMIAVLRRSLHVDPRKRFDNAIAMLAALQRAKPRALRDKSKTARRKTSRKSDRAAGADWRLVRRKQFLKEYGAALEARHACHRCAGPVSEFMQFCPWCNAPRKKVQDVTSFPQCCPRCHRGMKLDWQYCPWCFGPGFEVTDPREYSDRRYVARCANARCDRKLLMPFMKYCPWCRTKVKKKWPIPGAADKCSGCGWGVLPAFWSACPWCGKSLKRS